MGPVTEKASWKGRWRARLREGQWFLLGAAWLAALALGYAGFARYGAAQGVDLTPGDIFYLVLQLIPLNSGAVPPPVPWELEVARLLVPAVAAYTAVRALLHLFRDQWQILRLWRIRDHVVICGLGRMGRRLADSFARRGTPTVLLERDEENDAIETCRQRGQIVLLGDATDPHLLRQARLMRARYLIAVCGDDGLNAEIAMRAREAVRGRAQGTLTAILHVVDPRLCELLRAREISLEDPGFRLEILNVFDRGARLLLEQYPLRAAEGQDRPPHLLVVGLGYLGQTLVVQAARQWWGRGAGQPLRITVVDLAAHSKLDALQARYPQLADTCQFFPVEVDLHSSDFYRAAFLYDEQGRMAVDTAYFCIDDDALNLQAALILFHRAQRADLPLVLRMVEEAGLATLLQGQGPSAPFANLHAFGLLDRTLNPETVLAGTHETMARALHAGYLRLCRERAAPGAVGSPLPHNAENCLPASNALVEWDDLPEEVKEENRAQADCIGRLLRELGYGIAPLTDWDAASYQFSAEEVERMARLEHERWCERKRRAGWTYGAVTSIRAQVHADLVDWASLPEEEREKNRHVPRNLPQNLAQAGLQVYRLDGAAAGNPPPAPPTAPAGDR